MNAVVMVWTAVAAISATLGGVHVGVWLHDRKTWANLMFSISAFAVAAVAMCELSMMHADSIPRFVALMRWGQVPVFFLQTGIVMFVALQFGTGRQWLAWAATVCRLIVVVSGLFVEFSLQFRSIDALKQVSLLGEKVWVVDKATTSPWQILASLAGLLAFAFVADASVALWRKGGTEDRRRALFVGASIVFYLGVAVSSSALIHTGVITGPYLISIPFLAIVLTMGAELSRDVIRAAQMAEELQESMSVQRQMHDRFRESEARFRMIANSAPVMIWMSGTDKLCTFFNKGWLDFTGRAVEQELGNGWAEGVHADDFERCLRIYQDSFDAREAFTMEYRLRRHDGEHCWVLDNGVPHFAPDGSFLGYIGTAIDISPLRRAQSEAAQQREELAHVARVATLTELSGSLAHELNQPLAIILSNAQAAQRLLAREVPDVPEVREILVDIVAEDQRAGEVIRRMRALLKRGLIEPVPLSLHDVVEEVMRLLHSDLLARGVTVVREPDTDIPPILGDRVQLQQVVLNLITNGADAMAGTAPSTRRLHLSTTQRNGSVVLSVRDHGCGLPDNIEQLFVAFHTTKQHGLGMGLAICRTIVGAHHGRLWAERHPERGAIFHLELPVHKLNES